MEKKLNLVQAAGDLLCCPKCKNDLIQKESSLICSACGQEFKIDSGIPILVDVVSLSQHHLSQIIYFENEENIVNEEIDTAPWQESYIQRLLDGVKGHEIKTACDCGTGSGYITLALLKSGVRVVACDLTLKVLKRLQKQAVELELENNLTLVCCSAEELPFKNNTFDLYVSNAVMEHLPNEPQAISEAGRVVLGSGLAMVTVPLKYKFLNPIFILLNYVHDKRIGHLRRYDEKSIAEKFNNWKIVKIFYTGHFPKVFLTVVNLFAKVVPEKIIEKLDSYTTSIKYEASNITCFLQKND